MRNASGFTLFELLVALSLAAVLSGVAISGWRGMRVRWDLKSALTQVALDLRLTRMRSIVEGRPHRLHFDVPGSHYWREVQQPNRTYRVDGESALPAGIQILDCTGAGDAIGFQPRGHASPFGRVRLRGADGTEREIVVSMAGRMRIAP